VVTDIHPSETRQAAISALTRIVRRHLETVAAGEDPGGLSTLAD
jgi:hypothetical protein